MIVDKDRELGSVVSQLVGRHVQTGEIINAMGVSRSGYYLAREAGRAITADQLLNIARSFDLNPIDLMVRFGLLSADTAVAYVQELAAERPAPKMGGQRSMRLQRRPDSQPL